MTNSQGPVAPSDFDGYNTTGTTIPAFTAVRIDGAATHPDLGYPLPRLALTLSDDANTMPCAGITTSEILDGGTGTVRAFGLITDIDTSAFTVEDPLYISDTTPGGFSVTTNEPVGIEQRVATVLVSDAAVGIIFVCLNPQMDGHVSYTNRDQFEIYSSTPTAVLRLNPSGGEVVLAATPTGNRVLTLPDATDTLVGKATTDTLTNKTFDTAGAGNSLLINGLAATANTGTGAVVRADSPVFTTETTTPSAHILSSGAAFDIYLETNETLTADRRLRLHVSDANSLLAITGGGATIGGTHSGTSSGTNTGDQSTFGTIAVAGQSDVVADAANDTLTLVAGANVTLTTSAAGDSVTIAASGGGGSSATTVEANLGATAKFTGKFTITDAAISATSKVLCWQAPGPYTGKGTRADEAEMQPVSVIAVEPATGTAVVKWQTPPMIVESTLATLAPNFGGGTAANSGTNRDRQFTATRLGKVRGNVKFSYAVFA